MPDLTNLVETFSASFENLILALGRGVAEAQQELDQHSIQTQEALDSDPNLARFGLQATWYQFPKVDMELKLALSVTEDGAKPVAPGAKRPLKLIAQPVSAAYQNHFNYSGQASSTITLSIVPVPPPRAAQARMSLEEVQKAALASTAKFETQKDAAGNNIPSTKRRFDMNFNPAARLWYVLQYDPADPAFKSVVVAVDDATGAAKLIST
jgi:hypothetical protein